MDTSQSIFVTVAALITIACNLAVGIHMGMLIQARRDEAALDHLAAENCQLRKRLAATSGTCQPSAKRIRELEACLAESDAVIEFYLGSKPTVIAGMRLYAAGADVDVDEYLMRQTGGHE